VICRRSQTERTVRRSRPATRWARRFTVQILASGGHIKVYYNGSQADDYSVSSSGDYFKAGAYTQANCTNSSPCSDSNYGQVNIYHLTVEHS